MIREPIEPLADEETTEDILENHWTFIEKAFKDRSHWLNLHQNNPFLILPNDVLGLIFQNVNLQTLKNATKASKRLFYLIHTKPELCNKVFWNTLGQNMQQKMLRQINTLRREQNMPAYTIDELQEYTLTLLKHNTESKLGPALKQLVAAQEKTQQLSEDETDPNKLMNMRFCTTGGSRGVFGGLLGLISISLAGTVISNKGAGWSPIVYVFIGVSFMLGVFCCLASIKKCCFQKDYEHTQKEAAKLSTTVADLSIFSRHKKLTDLTEVVVQPSFAPTETTPLLSRQDLKG